jgi:hypothetical protein
MNDAADEATIVCTLLAAPVAPQTRHDPFALFKNYYSAQCLHA